MGAQTGRTFQDRSHVILVMEQENAPAAQTAEMNMLNVNVRGKRGNIVQTFPAVEYDFEPNDLTWSVINASTSSGMAQTRTTTVTPVVMGRPVTQGKVREVRT